MSDPRPILRRVGWLLIALGTLDIGVFIYCIANHISYSSSLNVFAVAAGVFLLRGHLGAVRYVTWSSAFAFSASLAALLIVSPSIWPLDYLMFSIRSHPWASVGYLLFSSGFLWMLWWVYSQLRLPPVVAARVAAGHPRGAPKSAFFAGGVMVVLIAVVLHRALNGDAAQQVIRSAEEQYGPGYHYFVSSIEWSGDHITVDVTAYNRDEEKQVQIDLE